jgi:serine/threonine protein kinase
MGAVKVIEIPSRRYGKYLVRSRLGQGGQAEVFLADATDERGELVNVALKLARRGEGETALADEADVMGLLSHPNLVRLVEVGRAFERPYIAMEYFGGGDLRGAMESHRRRMKGFPLGVGTHVVLEMLKGLAYFHQATSRSGAPLNLIHSDVNPSNVFFSNQGEVKLGDFGVASSSRVANGEPAVAGKLWYLSPEQTRHLTLTPASDLWAAGVMLHELVVGYHPFEKEGVSDEEAFALIRSVKVVVPEYVEKPLALIILKALAPEPKNRFRTAGEFAGALFGHALDAGLYMTPPQLQQWLEGALGLRV